MTTPAVDLTIKFQQHQGVTYANLGYDKLARALGPALAAQYGGHCITQTTGLGNVLYYNGAFDEQMYADVASALIGERLQAELVYHRTDYLPRKAQIVHKRTLKTIFGLYPTETLLVMALHGYYYFTDDSNRVISRHETLQGAVAALDTWIEQFSALYVLGES